MVHEADGVRARLAVRGLMRPAAPRDDDELEEQEPSAYSAMHRRLKNEMDDILKSGLRRRMDRVEQKVNYYHGRPPKTEAADTSRLQRSINSALKHADRCSKPIESKAFGPSVTQAELVKQRPDPQEQPEEVHRETVVLKATLQSLRQNIGSRTRQIAALSTQLEDCKKYYNDTHAKAEGIEGSVSKLHANPDALDAVHGRHSEGRKSRADDLEAEVSFQRSQASRYKELAMQQRAFYTQTERVSQCGGPRVIGRHPAGIVFLVPQPLSIQDEKAEAYDVGTAIANPYVCDSWPFEPNVLARRSFEPDPEQLMRPVEEETADDLDESKPRGRLDLLLPQLPHRDDSDEDYDGPSQTARSL